MARIYAGVIIIICSLLSACSGIQSQEVGREADGLQITPQQYERIDGLEWHLIEMTRDSDPIPLVEKSKVTFSCRDKGQVAGLATINRYFGNLKLTENGEIIWNKAFGMTRMAGPPELMQQEAVYMDTLMKTSRMYLLKAKLVLRNEDRSYVLEFEKIDK
jgi:heat shock protein HslJ